MPTALRDPSLGIDLSGDEARTHYHDLPLHASVTGAASGGK